MSWCTTRRSWWWRDCPRRSARPMGGSRTASRAAGEAQSEQDQVAFPATKSHISPTCCRTGPRTPQAVRRHRHRRSRRARRTRGPIRCGATQPGSALPPARGSSPRRCGDSSWDSPPRSSDPSLVAPDVHQLPPSRFQPGTAGHPEDVVGTAHRVASSASSRRATRSRRSDQRKATRPAAATMTATAQTPEALSFATTAARPTRPAAAAA
jgi:hypothetical protein